MNKEQRLQQIRDAARYKYPDERIHFIDGAKWADSHPAWIPVEERLPEFVYPIGAEIKNTSEYVLAYNGYKMYISRLVGGKIKWWEDNSELTPTHWMPLPIPPQRKEE